MGQPLPTYPLPPPVSPLIYVFLGGSKQGVNTLTEIFPEKIGKMSTFKVFYWAFLRINFSRNFLKKQNFYENVK